MDLLKTLFCKRRQKLEDLPIKKKRKISGLLCKLCFEYMLSSRTLPCGDSFCEPCLNDYLLEKTKCPVCSAQIQKSPAYPCFVLDEILSCQKKSSTKYQDRVDRLKELKEQLKIKELKVGMQIDVKDTEGIWCSGTIKNILNTEKATLLLVHYDKWDSIYDELFQSDSPRLAPHGFYTNRNILRYNLALNDGNRQAEVIFHNN